MRPPDAQVAPSSNGRAARVARERAVAVLAHRQHGVVSRAQLEALGLGRGVIRRWLERGRLHRVHRGVYAVGHSRLTQRGRLWAAVLACGGPDRAALSHRSAAAVDGLGEHPVRIDVMTFRRAASTPAIRVHRSRTLQRETDVVLQPDGLSVTSVARTLVDLADVLTDHQLERACHRAELLRSFDLAAIEHELVRANERRARRLRRVIAVLADTGPQVTRSDLEENLLELVAAADLPRPAVNTLLHGHEVDFLWPDQRLVVETDGGAAHRTATAFESDRRRDAELQVAGYRVVRFTWRQVNREPAAVIRTLRALLGGGTS